MSHHKYTGIKMAIFDMVNSYKFIVYEKQFFEDLYCCYRTK